MSDDIFRSIFNVGIRVLKVCVGLFSNNEKLIQNPEYFGGIPHPVMKKGEGWLISAQEANLEIEFTDYRHPPEMDGYFCIFDYDGAVPALSMGDEMFTAVGDWTKLEKSTADRRYSLLGNQGIFFRYLLTVLERKGIFSFHSCGLYDMENDISYLILGDRGSGKTALMLTALTSGRYRSFGTDIVHAGFENGDFVLYRGSMRNNVRVGHMIYDFPELAAEIGVEFEETENPWDTKVQLNFEKFGIAQERLVNPKLVLVTPRIEEELSTPHIHHIEKHSIGKLRRTLLENISDKIISLALAYEEVPVGSMDNSTLLRRRMSFVDNMMDNADILDAVNLFASPHNCLEGLQV